MAEASLYPTHPSGTSLYDDLTTSRQRLPTLRLACNYTLLHQSSLAPEQQSLMTPTTNDTPCGTPCRSCTCCARYSSTHSASSDTSQTSWHTALSLKGTPLSPGGLPHPQLYRREHLHVPSYERPPPYDSHDVHVVSAESGLRRRLKTAHEDQSPRESTDVSFSKYEKGDMSPSPSIKARINERFRCWKDALKCMWTHGDEPDIWRYSQYEY